MIFKNCLSLLCLNAALLAASAQEVVHLAADEWMPFNGDPAGAKPGYVVEFAREIFEPQGIQVEYTNIPWEDTLAATRGGAIDGAICANADEGAGLVLPKNAVAAPRMVILSAKSSAWKYENVRSLAEVRIGVIAEYAYWEVLDNYVARSDSSAVYVAEGEAPLNDLLDKLESGEIAALVESEAVLVWKLRERGKTKDDYRTVYRHMPDDVFVAFAPTERGRRFAALFDAGMEKLVASGRADEIAAAYGLKDWR